MAPTKGTWDYVSRNGLGGLTGGARERWEREESAGGTGEGEREGEGEEESPGREIDAFVRGRWRVEEGWETAWCVSLSCFLFGFPFLLPRSTLRRHGLLTRTHSTSTASPLPPFHRRADPLSRPPSSLPLFSSSLTLSLLHHHRRRSIAGSPTPPGFNPFPVLHTSTSSRGRRREMKRSGDLLRLRLRKAGRGSIRGGRWGGGWTRVESSRVGTVE